MTRAALITINQIRFDLSGPELVQPLSQFLRSKLQKTGTKVVCAEGDCGACTVLVRKPKAGKDPGPWLSINSCIVSLGQLHGHEVLTVESFQDLPQGCHPIQPALVQCQGSQCGYCTPGFVMSLAGFWNTRTQTTRKKVQNALTGNLCRCTGYDSILDAGMSTNQGLGLLDSLSTPKIRKELIQSHRQSVLAEFPEGSFSIPTSLRELHRMQKKYPKARILGGATDLGVAQNKGKLDIPGAPIHQVSLGGISELRTSRVALSARSKKTKLLVVGATTTLTELEGLCEKTIPELAELLKVFASPQIKNRATLAGNVVNASPIGDLIPPLVVLGASVVLHGSHGKRRLPIEKFILGYRKTALKKNEIVIQIEIPIPDKTWTLHFRKVAQRKDLDISYVSTAIALSSRQSPKHCRIAFGGLADRVKRVPKLEAEVIKYGIQDGVTRGMNYLTKQFQPRSDVRGSAEGRLLLAQGLLQEFVVLKAKPAENHS